MLLSPGQRLPALVDLVVSHEGDLYDATDGMPRCKELAELHSRSLTRLSLGMLDGPAEGNTLRLSGLPNLRYCALHVSREGDMPVHLRIDAASLRETPQLQNLYVRGDEALHLQDGSLGRLTALTSLTLDACGLRSVPVDVASLSATLCELRLANNDRMQIDDAAVASIVQCSWLEVLDLRKPNILIRWRGKLGDVWEFIQSHMEQEGYTPSQWSEQSVEHLVQLPSAFRERHGRDLRVLI